MRHSPGDILRVDGLAGPCKRLGTHFRMNQRVSFNHDAQGAETGRKGRHGGID
ncbi:hypothetical protein ENKO_14790 [Enterobacter kobei]|uniref:Uncharacterized protein n=1 Tax=Enterobacter kobei TaxID=208224 RepID=A0AA86M5N7_9ENTR|nr:hypothetical protein ENKO_14790 [Enterobacter kobei]